MLLSLVLLKEQHLDRPFPDMPYAGVFAPLPLSPPQSEAMGRGGKGILRRRPKAAYFPSPRPSLKASGRGEGQGRGEG